MIIKPRIFIGSSKEGIDVANFVKKYLSATADCFVWTDDIFKFNKSYFNTLIKEVSFFDFGILVATKDDYIESRDRIFQAPRDNVIFEFGLFLGRLGANRAFIVQEEGVKLPSDLFGISMPTFVKEKEISKSTDLVRELERVQEIIHEKIKLGELGLLPSTALAIGYFYNFIARVCESIHLLPKLVVDGKVCKSFELNIVIPKDLDADISKRAMIYTSKNKYVEHSIPSINRGYPLYINREEVENGILKLYDMPTTLSGIDKAIEMYIGKSHIGKDQQQEMLEKRELNNFKLVLYNLIQSNALTRESTKLIDE